MDDESILQVSLFAIACGEHAVAKKKRREKEKAKKMEGERDTSFFPFFAGESKVSAALPTKTKTEKNGVLLKDFERRLLRSSSLHPAA